MAHVMVVDDEPDVLDMMARTVREAGHRTTTAISGAEAQSKADRDRPAAAILDYRLPDTNGLALFQALRARHPDIVGLIVTAYASYDDAVRCINAGMSDYLPKPFKPEQLGGRVLRLLGGARGTPPDAAGDFDGMVGRSPAMLGLFDLIRRIAPLDVPVLIQGETGTGKELVARSIHKRSRRAAGPFIDVNCAAIPTTLFESEFFGHERGAFTDAKEMRRGRFEEAHRGTLFLDEVGELPPEAQAKLLRVIQQRQVTRLGSGKPRDVDVRLVCATNIDLRDAVVKGRFREDLYWRLGGTILRPPPLRERPQDLAALTDHLLEQIRQEMGFRVRKISAPSRAAVLGHAWPGNVRELRQVLLAASVASGDSEVVEIGIVGWMPSEPASPAQSLSVPIAGLALRENVERGTVLVERHLIVRALAQNTTFAEAARALGIDQKTLNLKRHRYGIDAGAGEWDDED